MKLQAYQGHYENGYFHIEGRKIQLPVRRKMTIIFEDSIENKADEQEINKRLDIAKSLRGIIPSNFDMDALREERMAERGLL
ncbi:MAG: hypothetical protein FWF81_11380 [Defluviitaleaceae bacterium]|nr:hypothetical protein [Defluviitaleaceae bacterium]